MSETFTDLAAELAAAGLPLPKPMHDAIGGAFKPLSLETRQAWPRWASERGYSDSQITTLMRAVARLTRHPTYLECLAADLSERVDVDGNPMERVRAEDRLAAAMMALKRATRAAQKAKAGAAQSNASKTPMPSPAAAAPAPGRPGSPRRPILTLKGAAALGTPK
jgi:sRNA-binding protein